jgi:hypothetical protein
MKPMQKSSYFYMGEEIGASLVRRLGVSPGF